MKTHFCGLLSKFSNKKPQTFYFQQHTGKDYKINLKVTDEINFLPVFKLLILCFILFLRQTQEIRNDNHNSTKENMCETLKG